MIGMFHHVGHRLHDAKLNMITADCVHGQHIGNAPDRTADQRCILYPAFNDQPDHAWRFQFFYSFPETALKASSSEGKISKTRSIRVSRKRLMTVSFTVQMTRFPSLPSFLSPEIIAPRPLLSIKSTCERLSTIRRFPESIQSFSFCLN